MGSPFNFITMTYRVRMCRTAYAFRVIEVQAETEEEAEREAYEVAGDFEYSEKDAEYQVIEVEEEN